MSDKKLLKEFVTGVIVERADDDDNLTQTLTLQQFDARHDEGCPVCGGELMKRPRMSGDMDDEGNRAFAGNFYVCRRNPDPNHYNLSIPHGNKPARERYRGPKPETVDSIPSLVKPNDGSKRVIRRKPVAKIA